MFRVYGRNEYRLCYNFKQIAFPYSFSNYVGFININMFVNFFRHLLKNKEIKCMARCSLILRGTFVIFCCRITAEDFQQWQQSFDSLLESPGKRKVIFF